MPRLTRAFAMLALLTVQIAPTTALATIRRMHRASSLEFNMNLRALLIFCFTLSVGLYGQREYILDVTKAPVDTVNVLSAAGCARGSSIQAATSSGLTLTLVALDKDEYSIGTTVQFELS